MTTRYCPRCAEEVEDTGGYCLLGHKLTLEAPIASIQELREEVDRAFEQTRISLGLPVEHRPVPQFTGYVSPQLGVAAVSVETVAPPTEAPSAPVAPETPPSPSPVVQTKPSTVATAVPAAPPPRLRRTPPPPPPPRALKPKPVVEWVEQEVDLSSDPMAAFAPPPRMDWGPDKGEEKPRRKLRRLRTSEA